MVKFFYPWAPWVNSKKERKFLRKVSCSRRDYLFWVKLLAFLNVGSYLFCFFLAKTWILRLFLSVTVYFFCRYKELNLLLYRNSHFRWRFTAEWLQIFSATCLQHWKRKQIVSCSNIIGSDKNVTSAPFKIADRRCCLTVRLNEDNFYKKR